jgi:hypothetical protein
MKFMLMMMAPHGDGRWVSDWTPEDLRAHMQFMHRFNEEIEASGERVDAEGLAEPREAVIVRAGKAGGAPEITDGPFPETKEFLAGFWIIDCESRERAYEIAARASSAPGPGGVPLHIPIEVREVLTLPPTEQ